jgi:hypothetical protein
VLIY